VSGVRLRKSLPTTGGGTASPYSPAAYDVTLRIAFGVDPEPGENAKVAKSMLDVRDQRTFPGADQPKKGL